MNVRITKPIQGGTIRAIASKSDAHRLLICAALADGETFLDCPERSEDIDATARCLEALGAAVRYERNGFCVRPIRRMIMQASGRRILDCGESGSTLRFMLPICGALGINSLFNMSGRLPERPLSGLCDEMAAHGCKLSEPDASPMSCEGRLTSGSYALPGNISSQFISGLLFALPLLPGDSELLVTGVLESRPYVDMTLDKLRLFGVKIFEDKNNAFRIPGNQLFCSPESVKVEGDWSNAAFWLAAGAMGQNGVSCTNLSLKSKQGDRAVAKLLSRFGAPVAYGDDFVTVLPGALRAIEIDAGDTPDLVPILAAVASVSEGKTIIRNAGRLRIKESDRLRTIAATLSGLGADVAQTEDGLCIDGKKELCGGETESFGDHRIAMAAAAVSTVCREPVTIKGAEAVDKSYPGFWSDFKTSLNGEWEQC
jgi:3-phosphoshikimate 1-carboxyvinyltransferase